MTTENNLNGNKTNVSTTHNLFPLLLADNVLIGFLFLFGAKC